MDQDRYTSVEKIERIARQMGLDYASGRRKLLESSMSELNRAIVKRTKRCIPLILTLSTTTLTAMTPMMMTKQENPIL